MYWTAIDSKNVNGLTFVSSTFPYNKPDSILIENLGLPQLIKYIQNKQVIKAYIHRVANFEFLRQCPNLQYVTIELNLPRAEYKTVELKGNTIYKVYDFEPLYCLQHLKYLNIIYNEAPYVKAKLKIDLSRFQELEMFYGDLAYTESIEKVHTLKTLVLNKYKGADLQQFRDLRLLDTLQLDSAKIHSLDGVENFSNLQCLYLYYNRSLRDIRALRATKKTLKALRIHNCANIEDFSVLHELENLELLVIYGGNVLKSLDFLNSMKNLKLFIFDANIEDGDLTPCLQVSHVDSMRNRRHYNLKDKDLPKGVCGKGNEDIAEWRRLE